MSKSFCVGVNCVHYYLHLEMAMLRNLSLVPIFCFLNCIFGGMIILQHRQFMNLQEHKIAKYFKLRIEHVFNIKMQTGGSLDLIFVQLWGLRVENVPLLSCFIG
eukprot:TRINITY_DN45198_c1_g1_i2.p4 TRINITY_DN45198_c1_g1~~TRINITY_DN45198_c1_g1_i2.p4  ORF type:complete len:104 (-),score=0.59 TRINITY_DN45198_c1_g1_i2:206-517(-)